MPPSERYKELKHRMGQYCARGEKSPAQVREKLNQFDISEDDIEKIIVELAEEGFVDPARFARAFVHDKFHFNKWGRYRIKNELILHHQIDATIVEESLENIEQEAYSSLIYHLIEAKWSRLSKEESTLIRRKKTVDFCLRKGFERDEINQQLDIWLSKKSVV